MRKLKPITWQYMTLYNKKKKLIHKIAAKHNDKDTEKQC